ncbi:unnamed protein product [Echinostoma caproni]|uniref:Ubiquitin-like modifier-activating enzyme ATG7 n=1 Tax=Echinostoma caproni TaxID=27848 RepID=A0A183A0B8_9TREM|nr:unnamed protein product [Echinostoma caproni]
MSEPLRYLPFETSVDTAFWHALARKKLEEFRLSQGPFILHSEFTNGLSQVFINDFGIKMFKKSLENNEYLKQPDMLLCFCLLTYLDLKRFKFYFWFAYPAVIHTNQPTLISSRLIDEELSVGSSNVYLGFCDPSTDPTFPGWPLRNILFAISASLIDKSENVKIICFRDRYSLNLSSIDQFVGWEKNNGQLKPQCIDLSSSMDPIKLSESAVDLNLKLIKWRLMPDLKLDVFRDTKCLLIGAGTLGCNVARQLMAWGIKHITFVDNATVSMSNPVRQSLFFFEDTFGEKKSKAVAAAKTLEKIFPGVCANGFDLNIPMPGHPISKYNEASIPKEFDLPESIYSAYFACGRLNDLIKNHDVIFLMTDTRESRWLPTLLGNFHQRLVINAALGFDTFLVMRHGLGNKLEKLAALKSENTKHQRSVPGYQLGCYFCSDVVGPANSVQNRSLDQQCTVTRPGVSMIAAAFAVELLISVLQHPLGANAPACTKEDTVPHQIRGFLSYFNQMVPAMSAFSSCSACSLPVMDAFLKDGFRFLLNVFDDSNYLEQVAGLKQLQVTTDDSKIVAFSDSE